MNEFNNFPVRGRFELAIVGSHEIAADYYRLNGEQILLTHSIIAERVGEIV
ncbi:hypothetical protein [Parasphingorhabdus sp.]|uniref:hypothetical protein n=1 Tax=Parasphingorhabdus sp. TaxID=2709688 RepID=UPI002F95ED91